MRIWPLGRVNGVSTRKLDRLVEQLGIDGMTKGRVSSMCRALDEEVEAFRQRPPEGAYPYLWLDAKQVKVRDHGRVVSTALVVASAVHETGGWGGDRRPGRSTTRIGSNRRSSLDLLGTAVGTTF